MLHAGTCIPAGPPGNARRFSGNLVAEVKRRFLNTLWNTYSFFVVYANLQESQLGGDTANDSDEAALQDRWLHSELNRLIRDVTAAYEAYDVTAATRPIADFVDELSNWYVRLNRRRFWDGDAAALSTLRNTPHYGSEAACSGCPVHLGRDLPESGRRR